jgi:Tfp pilus assembly protein PilF
MAAGFLGALWLAIDASWNSDWRKHLAALFLLALSLGAKEVAIVFPVVLFLTLALTNRPQDRPVLAQLGFAARAAAPYAGLGVAYFFVRLQVLGQFSMEGVNPVSLLSMALTAPQLVAFYLRQSLFPLSLGPGYEVESVELATLGGANFWIPILVVAVAAALTFMAMRRGAVQRIGAALFVLPLLPALTIAAFMPEHIVHDRYLSLPLLGLLMVAVPTLASVLDGAIKNKGAWVRATALGVAGLWCVSLLFLTIRYNRAWLGELALWEHAVAIAPGSAFIWTMYGYALTEEHRDQEALHALNRSLQTMSASSTPDALLKRAEIYISQGRLEDAVNDLRRVLAGQPKNVNAYEQLAIILQQAGQLDNAASILLTARQRVPSHDCEFSTNLAVVLYLSGTKSQALAELERVRGQAERKITPGCRLALFRLGQLYIELGRESEGRAALRQYLALTESLNDEASRRYRGHALRQLGQ